MRPRVSIDLSLPEPRAQTTTTPANTSQKQKKRGPPTNPSQPRQKKPRVPRTPKTPPSYLDVSAISLPGEKTHSVRIYDTCDTTRDNIREALTRAGVTAAAFLRAISSPHPGGRRVLHRDLNDFLSKDGPLDGIRNYAYCAAYVFFEKVGEE